MEASPELWVRRDPKWYVADPSKFSCCAATQCDDLRLTELVPQVEHVVHVAGVSQRDGLAQLLAGQDRTDEPVSRCRAVRHERGTRIGRERLLRLKVEAVPDLTEQQIGGQWSADVGHEVAEVSRVAATDLRRTHDVLWTDHILIAPVVGHLGE